MNQTQDQIETKRLGKKKDSGPRQWTESLDVKMTEKELAELAPRIDAAIAEVEALEEHLLCKKSEFKAQIELAESRVRELRHFAATGKKKADVKVTERLIFDTNTAEVIRLDTGEIVRHRPLTLEERQASLPLDVPTPAASASEASIANGKKADKAKSEDGVCTVEIEGQRCTRPDGHRGAHGLGAKKAAKES